MSEIFINPFHVEISCFSGLTGKTPFARTTILKFLNDIRDGKLKDQILHLRQMKMTDHKRYCEEKKLLQSVTLAGYFNKRNSKSLVKSSGFFHGNIEEIPDLPRTINSIRKDPYTAFCFISPGGDGLEFGIRINPEGLDHKKYKAYFKAIQKRFQKKHGVSLDKGRKDFAGLCSMSYDPDLFTNRCSEIFLQE